MTLTVVEHGTGLPSNDAVLLNEVALIALPIML